MQLRRAVASVFGRARRLVDEFQRHDTFTLAAALSYYTLLSFAPLVLVAVALAGIFFGRAAVEERIVYEMGALVGTAGAEVMQTVVQNAHGPEQGVALSIGLITLLVSATTVFVQLQDALDRIWDVPKKEAESAVRNALLARVLSFAMVISIGFLLLVSLIVSAALSAVQAWFHARIDVPTAIWQVVDVLVSFGVVTLLVALIFKLLPHVSIAWKDVWFGALTTALLFTVGKVGIGVYLGRASIGSAYGAAGSVVVLMVWTYYAAVIFFLGAMLTRLRVENRSGRAGAPA